MILILVHFEYNDHKKAQFVKDILELFANDPEESQLVAQRANKLYLKFTTEKSGAIAKTKVKPPARRSLIATLAKTPTLTPSLLATPSIRPKTATLLALPTTTPVRPKTAPAPAAYQLPLDRDESVPCSSSQTKHRDDERRAREARARKQAEAQAREDEEIRAFEEEETLANEAEERHREIEIQARSLAEAIVAEQVYILDKKLRQKEQVRNLYVQFSSKICSKLLSMKNKGRPNKEIREQLLIMVQPILEQLYIVVLGDENGDFDRNSASWNDLHPIREPIMSLIEDLLEELKNKTISTAECMKAAKNQFWLSESKTGLNQSSRALNKVSQKVKRFSIN